MASHATVMLLIWRDRIHFDLMADRPCVLCRRATPMRSHAGEPVHKTCAEAWNATHPDEARCTTPSRDPGTVRDVGTWRFHSDAAGPVATHPAAPSSTRQHRTSTR